MSPAGVPEPGLARLLGHSTNLLGLPTWLLADAAFNDAPQPLHISGTRETNPALFRMLEESATAAEAAQAFQAYMRAAFGPQPGAPPARPGRFRGDYLRLLQGWSFDSNSVAGAVLKGWVESRFGLFPTFHREPLGRYPSPAWMRYVEQKMSSRFHSNCISLQLDLLYEYCQWMMGRHFGGGPHITLYRGVNDFGEHEIVERLDRRRFVVRQNNLVSFSARRETAGEFGDTILEARVPVVKVLFFNALLPGPLLSGEGEYLVIGGDYRVEARYW
ncbi:MAG TPA: NAD(+)--dinitrogen-reductase ADP-D-ribosyltransferase [Burkholderiales bacterium]|nr:NAD(+)--dinitrogen-reductase ADP-D-ribosyltransferase [Burkholderiales bacterium]